MRVEIKADGLDSVKKFDHFATCCAGFELGPQRDKIESAQIQLASASELRGGKDQFCSVQVVLSDNHKIVTKAMDPDLHVAIYRALERAGWMIAHRQQREHRHAAGMQIQIAELQTENQGGPNWAA